MDSHQQRQLLRSTISIRTGFYEAVRASERRIMDRSEYTANLGLQNKRPCLWQETIAEVNGERIVLTLVEESVEYDPYNHIGDKL